MGITNQDMLALMASTLNSRPGRAIVAIAAALDADEPPDQKFLIFCCERGMWWKPNGRGYTVGLDKAGRYSWTDALSITRGANVVAGKVETMMVPVESWMPLKVDKAINPLP